MVRAERARIIMAHARAGSWRCFALTPDNLAGP